MRDHSLFVEQRNTAVAAGPDPALEVAPQQINGIARQSLFRGEIADGEFPVVQLDAGESFRFRVADPGLVGIHGQRQIQAAFEQAIGVREGEPLAAVEAGQARVAVRPHGSVGSERDHLRFAAYVRRNRHGLRFPDSRFRSHDVECRACTHPHAPVGGRGERSRRVVVPSRRLHHRGREGARVEAREAARHRQRPDGAITRNGEAPHGDARDSVLLPPDAPASFPRIPHGQAVVGARPQTLLVIAHDRPDH